MEPSVYRKKWTALKNTPCSGDALSQLARQVAFSFVDRYYQKGLYRAEYIDLLCEMATSFSDPEINNRASSALFEIIVEKLCDDYEEMPVEIYSRVMSQVISYCRNVPEGATLDRRLTNFGIFTFDDLYNRANLVHSGKYTYSTDKPPEKIILLSRVTIGADVAILSVMIQQFVNIFPDAEIVIIGNAKLEGVFGGNPRIQIRRLSYARGGGLFERFSSWYAALDIIEREMPPETEQNILLIDPDSRISQLGVLPFTHSDNYFFFNSRRCDSSSKNVCMAELANRWINDVFGTPDFCYPAIWIPSGSRLRARRATESLHVAGCRRVIAVNFGVGTNPRKRLSYDFEIKLLREILKTPWTVVLLDRGFGQEELSRSGMLLADISDSGFHVSNICFTDSKYPEISQGIIGIECAIGEVAALIAECDEFIGYDSACQHIAAATQTPTLTIFAGSNNMNFVRRWSAFGYTQCKIVHVNTLTDHKHVDMDEVILRIMEERAAEAPVNMEHTRKILEIKAPHHTGKPAKKAVDG
jgi:hypothetical protein